MSLSLCHFYVDKLDKLHMDYHQISNISYTKSQNLIVSHLVLQLSLANLLKPCVKLKMKM